MTILKLVPKLVIDTPNGERTIAVPAIQEAEDLSMLADYLAEVARPEETDAATLKRVFDDMITNQLLSTATVRAAKRVRERRRLARESGAGEV